MAVYDLANIGLEGQQAFYTRMQTAAQAETMHAAAQKSAFDLEQEQRMQALSDEAASKLQSIMTRQDDGSSNLLQDPGDDQAGVLDQLGKLFIAGGAPKAGMDFLKGASDIRGKQSEIENRTSEMEQRRLLNIQKGAEIAGQKLGKARNQAEWDQGLREVEDAGIIEPHLMAQLKQMPYDPDVAAYFFDQAVKAGDQAKLDLQRQTQSRLANDSKIRNEQAERRIQIQQARAREQDRHDKVMEKNAGSKGNALPGGKELSKTASLVLKNDPIFKDVDTNTDNFKLASDYIASQTRQILKSNKAIDMNTAANQALIQAKASGAFSTTPGEEGFLGLGSKPKTTTFRADGLQRETARPLPPGIKSAEQAKSQLKKGQWYLTTRGPAQWNGSAWEQ